MKTGPCYPLTEEEHKYAALLPPHVSDMQIICEQCGKVFCLRCDGQQALLKCDCNNSGLVRFNLIPEPCANMVRTFIKELKKLGDY